LVYGLVPLHWTKPFLASLLIGLWIWLGGRLIPVNRHNRPIQRPHQGDRDKPAEDRQASRWGFDGGITHEAEQALVIGVVKAIEDNLL
jgi:hypothetical protein